MGKALVTGGSGFIGSHLIALLIEAGWTVVNIDVKEPILKEHRPYWVRASVIDGEALVSSTRQVRPSIIYNLAANASLHASSDELRMNAEGLRNIIRASRCVSAVRVVHASTQLVVGPGYEPKADDDLSPYTEYGKSKAECERLLRSEEGGDVDWTVVRPTTVWGPYHPTFAQTIWRYLRRGWYLHPGGGSPIRSYGYVGNVVEQMYAIASAPKEVVQHQTFYVGDRPMRSIDWADAFSRALRGYPSRRVPRELLMTLAKIGDVIEKLGVRAPLNSGRYFRMTTDYIVPMERTFKSLGAGSVSFEEGVSRTANWLLMAARDL